MGREAPQSEPLSKETLDQYETAEVAQRLRNTMLNLRRGTEALRAHEGSGKFAVALVNQVTPSGPKGTIIGVGRHLAEMYEAIHTDEITQDQLRRAAIYPVPTFDQESITKALGQAQEDFGRSNVVEEVHVGILDVSEVGTITLGEIDLNENTITTTRIPL